MFLCVEAFAVPSFVPFIDVGRFSVWAFRRGFLLLNNYNRAKANEILLSMGCTLVCDFRGQREFVNRFGGGGK